MSQRKNTVGISDLPGIRKAIVEAEKNSQTQFKYKDIDLDLQYAKYLVEYMTSIQKEYQ